MKDVLVVSDGHTYRALRALSFADRLLGMRRTGGEPLLIDTGAVHAIGLGAFTAVGITSDMTVSEVRVADRGRFIRLKGAVHTLELPLHFAPPRPGSSVEVIDV